MTLDHNEDLDLVEEMEWEDCDKVVFVTLEEAGLEDVCFDTVQAECAQYFDEEGGSADCRDFD
jgi:hypothetical protein